MRGFAAIAVLAITIVVLGLTPAARADKRVALVIGNSDYRTEAFLPNPRRDAKAVSDALRAVGFVVTPVMDVGRDAMVAALRAFRVEADTADWALIYYAGHGIEIDGVNYLNLDGLDHFVTEVLRAPYLRYVDDFALFHDHPAALAEWRLRIDDYLIGRRLKLHPRKTVIEQTAIPSQFLGFELHANGHRRLPEDNVRRFRNRLRGLRDQWRAGTVERADIDARVHAWIAHAENADTWRLRHAIFRSGWFDPAQNPEAWTAPCRRVLRGGSCDNNPRNLRAANRNRNTAENRNNNNGFRLGSTLSAGAGVITVPPGAHY